MTLLDSLTEFVKSNMPKRAMEGFDSLMDEVRFEPAARDLGAGQYRLSIMQYTVTLEWARFPFRVYDPQIAMALVQVWYMTEGAKAMDNINMDWELPEIDVELREDETAVVLITGSLSEPMDLLEDPDGPIPFDGRRWSLAKSSVWVAEQLTMFVGNGDGTWPVQSEVS